jgi:hypothetical protein
LDGDYYLRTSNGDVYNKIAGTWTVIANIEGPTGPTGPTGPNGVDFPAFAIVNTAVAITLNNSHFSGNKILEVDSATAVNITINTGLTGVEPLLIEQKGVGQVSLNGTATLRHRNGLRTAGQYSVISVIPKGSNVFLVAGDASV